MQTDVPKHHKRRRSEPSLWADEPIEDVFALLENALRENQPARRGKERRDEHHSEIYSEVYSLREENARLRQLLAQLSGPIR
ncbi:MAG: hypothetical protein KGK01_11965 [Bradyrhizobium sp.]|nr:hypothetical protein [Bradyrhizobium sp.]